MVYGLPCCSVRRNRPAAGKSGGNADGNTAGTAAENSDVNAQGPVLNDGAFPADCKHLNHCTMNPVTIATATKQIIVPPEDQGWHCSCRSGHSIPAPPNVGKHEMKHFVECECMYHGPPGKHHRYLRRYHLIWVRGVIIHTEFKQYRINGLEEDEFWVEGERVVPRKGEDCHGCEGCKDS